MSDEVWAVSSGCYSDYSVLCVCPSKADAEAVAAKFNAADKYEEARVESFPVVDRTVEQLAVLKLQTTLWDDGTETDTREHVEHEWPFHWEEAARSKVVWRWVRAPMHHDKGGRLEVSGVDHERVRRVYSDHRAELIAEHAVRSRKEAKGRVPA